MTPELLTALSEWMPHQRWFAGKGTTPALRHVGSYDFTPPSGASGVDITTALLLDEGGQQPTLYHVPLTLRAEPAPELSAAHITTLENGLHVYDGPNDTAYAHALLALITGDAATSGAGATTATGRSQVPGHPLAVSAARVLSGEQSNTSIIMSVVAPDGDGTPGPAAAPVICKVFRVLHHGNNPDVVLQSALAAAGSTRVPASIGSVVGQWPDQRMPDGRTSGHLAFAQEFLPGVRDAWRVALEAVDEGRLFTAEAAALGAATAEVHETLAAVMPTVPPSDDLVAGVLASMRRRHAGAVHEVPELAEHNAAIERLFEAAANSPWPQLQRIHGDYHLGQVLAVPPGHAGSSGDDGSFGSWVLVDFEGEPLRPMVERSQPDLALRDVAGMLRSFDYAAGSHAHSNPGESAAESAAAWAQDARQAFLGGYVSRSGLDLTAVQTLLDAFEIDKALYEAIYEARNRPTWLPIPVAAIARLATPA
ncbi:maltokinase N-terminal cap-like domain-containing protein [Subtercola endophyticus]|uniref:maltokinase N-terminal cap-like domain-containing protein n=1 Tax=Subtercola endophyticus TaxID=2895559 RepID=UPI001E356561|nr:phosphotransferase [Subtercola endophyticus]UFS60109.1 phosphotransferase [Subtercola endophyticus]